MLMLLDQVLHVETDPNGEARIVRLHDDWVNTGITSGTFVPWPVYPSLIGDISTRRYNQHNWGLQRQRIYGHGVNRSNFIFDIPSDPPPGLIANADRTFLRAALHPPAYSLVNVAQLLSRHTSSRLWKHPPRGVPKMSAQ